MIIARVILTVALVFLLSAAHADELRWFSWPSDLLLPNDDLEIVEIHLKVECGEIRSVSNLPSDWNLSVIRPISAVAEFNAEAGHGASHLPNLAPLNGVIGIAGIDHSCFRVVARVVSHRGERSFTVGLSSIGAKPNITFLPTPSVRPN